jgi:hypothetical protein
MVEIVVSVEQRPLIVLAGPTASGKTSLAIRLAQRFEGEIVSCDSVAVYREMEIGTAKPTASEREMVPHHLIDVAWPNEQVTAGDYSRLAREALGGIVARGRIPIVAGGTGLYLRALIDGLFPAPQARPELRERLRERAEKKGASASCSDATGQEGRGGNPPERCSEGDPGDRSLAGRDSDDGAVEAGAGQAGGLQDSAAGVESSTGPVV